MGNRTRRDPGTAVRTCHEGRKPDVELLDVLVDAGESAKDLDRPGMVRILEMVQSRVIGMVIVAKQIGRAHV